MTTVLCDSKNCIHREKDKCDLDVIEVKDRGRKYFQPRYISVEN